MMRCWPKRRWLQAIFVVFAVVLLPYLVSRMASPSRSVSIFRDQQGASRDQPDAHARIFDGRLRVVAYNIAHGRGLATSNWEGGDRTERRGRLSDIAEVLTELDADVVVLNEVDFDSSWSEHLNQAELIALLADYPYRVEQRNLDFRVLGWTWRFGNAVLSRYPIERAELIDLPSYSTWESVLVGKKRAVGCELRCGEQSIRVIAAHLSHRSEAIRVASAARLQQQVLSSEVPTLVAGDLNSTPPGFPNSKSDNADRNAIGVFDEGGYFQRRPVAAPPPEDALTFPSNAPNQVIDWILVPSSWWLARYEVIPSQLSDHRPVVAEIDLRASAEQDATTTDE